MSTKKIVLLLVVANIAAAAGYGFALTDLGARGDRIRPLAEEAASYAQADIANATVKTSLGRIQKDAVTIDSFYVGAAGVVDFISTIEGLARQNGLDLVMQSVDSVEVDKQTRSYQERLRLRVNTRGSWSDTEHFLLLIENLPFAVSVETASLDKSAPAAEAGQSGASAGNQSASVWKGDFIITALKLK